MSRNVDSRVQDHGEQKEEKRRRAPDQRIRRTHARLGSALVSLIQEKSMDDVTVQEVLDRASIGRSTFYLHFRDKDDLLLSQFEQFLEMMSTALSVRKEESHRVVPVAEMFEHIGSQKKFYRMLEDSGRLDDFFELAEGYFARGIERRLKELKRLPKLPQRELTARTFALAGSLLSLLRWWMDRGTKESPATMDEMFHRMVWNGFQ
ncbi:TetR/AcrR family transcriptional regulator [Alloacidobacterium dinghuense]|uniref:TetR/AcrR family transcriptional regulator n=1 Tax=Alloacidobacterium dinghuense TaxID=2763107 RepID=A0A7G8BFJ3_9BACT|nr:TetR/AcrR family transcriptional regulator [Alloacidobacterium dinghuense]QNI31313.1 TetR/AcrR family transcriptional regulator [Alloacidobacterium dinghuense]